MNELRNQGYMIIPNNNNELFQQKMMTFYQNNNKINYKELRSFVDDIFFPTLMNKINNNEKVFYSKFRFSNNNNSFFFESSFFKRFCKQPFRREESFDVPAAAGSSFLSVLLALQSTRIPLFFIGKSIIDQFSNRE